MMPTPLPFGWHLMSIGRIPDGCLNIQLMWGDSTTYSVIWHTVDIITVDAYTDEAYSEAIDPVVVMLAMMIAAERHLSPDYTKRPLHPGSGS
jgi:hypothetical protein